MRTLISTMVLALALSGCGGGGGGSATINTSQVKFSVSPGSITEGSSATLTWSSTNTTSCTASGNDSGEWSGSQPASGSQMVTPPGAGSYTYTLTCSGAGGPASNSATLAVTIRGGTGTNIFYSFSGAPDGATPDAGLVQGTDGNFYGTTRKGGSNDNGTVFKITPSGIETVLYRFNGGSDAADPLAGLVQGTDGNFYGTTGSGGSATCFHGCGTVFKMTPSGIETVLYSFTGGADGSYPFAGLVQGTDGSFYGTTQQGGAATCSNGCGTVFKITPSGTETVLYRFKGGSDGAVPQAGLVQGTDGNFYGTTQFGGVATCSNGCGTAFKMTPSGIETVLYSFTGGADGSYPLAGLVQGTDGNFYGTTVGGGSKDNGAVFKMTPSGIETVLYSFTGGADGSRPFAGLVQGTDGNFYGTTQNGGGSKDDGTVFKMTPSGVETVFHSFTGDPDGASPQVGVVQGTDGNFYGTTQTGGSGHFCGGCGTAFKLTAP